MPPDDRTVVRIYPNHAAKITKSCPRYLAAKARPVTWKALADPAEQRGLDTFATAPVEDVLDRVEFDARTAEEALADHFSSASSSRWHPGLRQWIVHAVQAYLRTTVELSEVDGKFLRPVEREWAVQHPARPQPGQDVREMRAIGRGYESPDGEVREIRMLRTHSVAPLRRPVPPPDLPELAATAIVVADGRMVLGRWNVPLAMSRTVPAVRRVRIVEIGLYDGTRHVVFDETAARTRELYARHARSVLSESVNGEGYLPGHDCVRCRLRDTCPALPRRPGLLGVHGPTAPARSWSVTTGRRYQNCPGQAHFRDLRLPYPAASEYSLAARRGKAVHQWIEDQHNRVPRRPCHPAETPLGPSWWPSWSLHGEAVRLGEQMIGDHAEECPLARMTESDTIRSEHPVVVYDQESNVVVHAKIDTVYTDSGTTVLRETKTTTQVDEGDLLRRYPQIALYLVLAGEGLFGDRSRVELERLTPAGALVTRFEPTDAWLVAEARAVMHALAAPWHGDLSLRPTPGKVCDTCEMSIWCPETTRKDS